MSVHDEVSVRLELERELGDVVPRGDVAATVIGRYRRERRRRRAGLAVAVAGLGVPLTVVPLAMISSAGAGGQSGAVLRIAAYTLQLPASYRAQPCGGASLSAASAAGGCVMLALTPASRSGRDVGTGRDVGAGRYRVRPIAHGLVVESPAPGAPGLTVTATSLSEPALERLVATGLRYAA